jgi:hypothetical protein
MVVGGGIVGAGLAVVIAAGAALIASSPAAFAGCGVPGAMRAAYGHNESDSAKIYVVNFAPDSGQLNPVAERVLSAAAASYPNQPTIEVQVKGGERQGSAPLTVELDRYAVVTAYLVRHDVPLGAIAFDKGQLAQTGCNERGA